MAAVLQQPENDCDTHLYLQHCATTLLMELPHLRRSWALSAVSAVDHKEKRKRTTTLYNGIHNCYVTAFLIIHSINQPQQAVPAIKYATL